VIAGLQKAWALLRAFDFCDSAPLRSAFAMTLGAVRPNNSSSLWGRDAPHSTSALAAGLIASFALTRGMTTMLLGGAGARPRDFLPRCNRFFLIATIATGFPH